MHWACNQNEDVSNPDSIATCVYCGTVRECAAGGLSRRLARVTKPEVSSTRRRHVITRHAARWFHSIFNLNTQSQSQYSILNLNLNLNLNVDFNGSLNSTTTAVGAAS